MGIAVWFDFEIAGILELGNLSSLILWAIGLFAAGAEILVGIANVTKHRR